MTAVLRRYFRGRKLNTMEDVLAGKKYVYHFDHQGSTQALTDATTGAVTDRFASDAWGVQVKRTGTSPNHNWYLGDRGFYRQVDHLHDYAVQRYYEPLLATMISPSVAGQSGGYWARIPATAQVSGIACSPAGCPAKGSGPFRLPAVLTWLNRLAAGHPRCEPRKLACTMEALGLIADAGGSFLGSKPISARLVRHWLSGRNQTYPIPFSRLLQDSNFKGSYNYILSQAEKRACKATSFTVRDVVTVPPKEFKSGTDLFFSLHQYELFARVTVVRTGIGCSECNNGEVSKITIRFPFTDRYD